MFRSVEPKADFPAQEVAVAEFWKERQIYQQTLAARKDAPNFVFFEGPPTANGMPHPGHCLTRVIKDLFPRYRTMRGYRCERKAGWDTHGLPVEQEVCRQLGIHSKEEIEAFGVEPFIHRCRESVWRYMQQWEKLTERLGFWIQLDEAYVTYHQSYVESVWWALKSLFDRGLLYQGHKIVWWWAQGGTALSAGEVGQGYREVADPSVYVRFPLLDEQGEPTSTNLLVWTTTPWTLPSNQFAAVKEDMQYSEVVDPEWDGTLIMASSLVETISGKVKRDLEVKREFLGKELLGKRYRPPFDYYYQSQGNQTGKLKDGGEQHLAWRVIHADFVTDESGTGVVHQAPAFGEVDFGVLQQEQARFEEGQGPDLICAVASNGTFTEEAPDYEGMWVKEADRPITRRLREEQKLYHQEQYVHQYPFCWRADDDPLIQYPRQSWFVRTTQFRDTMLKNNSQINWLPEHIRDGRFGNFLENNVDWALSRERYWGTPLPIWQCEKTGYQEAIGSYQELLAKPGVEGTEVWEQAKSANPELVDDLKVHKPYIDAITYQSPKDPKSRMKRVSEVIDCWFDSGAMPFAQWGYPHQNQDKFLEQFPADFISEAIDQTRGWFYSQLAISTLLFSEEAQSEAKGETQAVEFPHPFRNCIVLGLMLGGWWESKDGKQIYLTEDEAKASGEAFTHRIGKMSKQKRNYREPFEIFDRYGADVLRWYFLANQPPWTEIRYSEEEIKKSVSEFLLRLWNVYSFFVIYANIDQYNPAADLSGDVGDLEPHVLQRAKGYRPVKERGELDRFILSELHRTSAKVIAAMDAYDNFAACSALNHFVDVLSNWYVRRSRDRFWSNAEAPENKQDKADAHWTLYESLVTCSKLVAPFVPFFAETLWQNLAVEVFGKQTKESVHLCDFPTPAEEEVDETLSKRMSVILDLVSLGRSARNAAKIKVRQPLGKVEVILSDQTDRTWLEAHAELIAEELNVKKVEFSEQADHYINYQVLPDLKKLGPRLGKKLPVFRKKLGTVSPSQLLSDLEEKGSVEFDLDGETVEISREELMVRLEAKEGWAASHSKSGVVVLATELTPELVAEGLARELVHAIQGRRKDMNLDYNDRIRVSVVTQSEELSAGLESFGNYVQAETQANELLHEPLPDVESIQTKLNGHPAEIYVSRA